MYEGIEDIYTLLEERRLKEALAQLQGICANTNDWPLRNKVEEAMTAYGYMLQYAGQGMDDPNRKRFYQDTLRKAYELTDRANITLLAGKKSGTFFDRFRTLALHPAKPYADLQMQLEAYTEDMGTAPLLYHDKNRLKAETDRIVQIHESALKELFDKTWTTLFWSDMEAREAQALLESVLVSSGDLAVMISAITLNLLRVFDERKVHFLLNACRHENPQVSQRAIVGLAITLLNKGKRLPLYPDLQARLSLMAEEEDFCKNLRTIQMQLIITRETEKIDKKMQEEILPEMMKNAKKMNDPKFIFDDPEDMEKNPEWGEWMDQSGMSDKIKMMSEWQMEGADVYMSSFAQLKHYPFFHEITHWFYPFDKLQSELAELREDFETTSISPLRLITASDFFCNSDKYSFCFAILSMPRMMKEQAMNQLQAQADMDAEKKERLEALMNQKTEAKGISRQYIQDLYRFFKLWKHGREEKDIFKGNIRFWHTDTLGKAVFKDDAFIKEVGDFLFQKEHLNDALEIYSLLIRENPDIAEVWQKKGFINQKLKDYPSAIKDYERADLLAPDNVWTNLHIAQCHWASGCTEKALEYYRKVEAVQPDDLKTTLKIGQCLARIENYSEALTYFYKVEYLEKKPDNARRAIAWCLFVTGKHEEALRFYRQLLENPSPSAQDWMNTGHVYLVTRRIPQAKEHYLKAQEAEKSHSDFLEKFNQDKKTLLAQGLSEEDLSVMTDLLV